MIQFDRKYKLQVGDRQTGEGLTIDTLRVSFSVRKSSNNKDKIDKCSISVYNLSYESLAVLESEYPVAILSCGYKNNVVRLFYGEITQVETTKSGTDRITKIKITPSFSDLTHKLMSELVPENGTVLDAIEAVRRNTSLAKGTYKGKSLNTPIVYGYPLSGTPRQMLDQITSAYNLEWKIEGQSLYINSPTSVQDEILELAPVISETTGLISAPYFFTGTEGQSKKDKEKTRGVRFRALINPNVLPGTIVKIEYKDVSEFLRVQEVEFTGDTGTGGKAWYMDCLCAARVKEN